MSGTDSSESKPTKRPYLEMTPTAIILGIILSIVMGAANVYLGLKVGMTVSASIPAAVIATGVLRGLLRRKSVLEANLVQTAASAGESLAAGIIFTMPAMIIIGAWTEFDFWTTSLIALAGGLLGVLLMIPMRRIFVVENDELKYPEGVACAEVLQAGDGVEDDAQSGLTLVIVGILTGAVFKACVSLIQVFRSTVEGALMTSKRVLYFGADMPPALVSVGFIVGLPIAFQIFLGGTIGWLIAIPLMEASDASLAKLLLAEGHDDKMAAVDIAWELWKTKVRYVGVGAMVVGGLASLWKTRHGLVAAVKELSLILTGKKGSEAAPEDRNLSMSSIVFWTILCTVLIASVYYSILNSIALTALTTTAMFVLSFFMAAVASYIVGLVGNSNSPVSGMTIMAVLATGAIIWLLGFEGQTGQIAVLVVAGVVCCVACTSGDVCNDLKTGHIVGASPRSQQIMQVIGVVAGAFIMAPVLGALDKAYTIGSKELSAPQAGLFASLTEGFFGEESLPHQMLAIGAVIGVVLLIIDVFLAKSESSFRLHVMPVAVGIYLPFGIAPPMLLGGLLSWWLKRRCGKGAIASEKRGVLISSGIIAGESLLGVGIGFILFAKGKYPEMLGEKLPEFGNVLASMFGEPFVAGASILAFLAVAALLYFGAKRGAANDG